MLKLIADKLSFYLPANRRTAVYTVLLAMVISLPGVAGCTGGNQQLSDDGADMTVAPWYRGADNAPVTIDVYPDFTCGVCLEEERFAVRAFDNNQGKIRLIYHPYPASGVSELIAEALEAAGDQGKFWEMHDRLIDDSTGDISHVVSAAKSFGLSAEEYAVSRIMTEAEMLGINTTRLNEDLETGRFTQKIQTARQDAVTAGVKSTSVFINGKECTEDPATYDDFLNIVNAELPTGEAIVTN